MGAFCVYVWCHYASIALFTSGLKRYTLLLLVLIVGKKQSSKRAAGDARESKLMD